MILPPPPRIPIDRLLAQAVYAWLLGIPLLLLICTLILFWTPSSLPPQPISHLPSRPRSNPLIGSGALQLTNSSLSPLASRLFREVKVLAINTRPDAPSYPHQVLLMLKGSGEQLLVGEGEEFFVGEEEGGRNLCFSKIQGAIALRVQILGEEEVQLSLRREGEEAQSVALIDPSLAKRLLLSCEPAAYMQQLQSAKLWDRDQLYVLMGGEEYEKIQTSYRLEIASEQGRDLFFIGPGDLLTWTGERWTKAELGRSQEGPLARICGLSSIRGAEIECWDASGLRKQKLDLPLERFSKLSIDGDALPKQLRMKGPSQISCLLGKRRALLKVGDWLLRQGNRWRLLRAREEIEQCLNGSLRGPLLVLGDLTRSGEACILNGYLFNEMRTEYTKMALPVIPDKQKNRKTGPKKT